MDDYELVMTYLRKAIAATDDVDYKLQLQQKLDRMTSGFRSPGGCGDRVMIAVHRKD